jgi:hypothetical protein
LLVYTLWFVTDAVTIYATWLFMNNELERIWKEAAAI